MTMPYTVRESSILDVLNPGDQVKAEVVVDGEGAYLDQIQVTAPATDTPGPAQGQQLHYPREGEKVPPLHLVLQSGKKLDGANLKGQTLVITFIYTRCPFPNYCPLLNKNFSEIATALQADPAKFPRTRLLSISIDPGYDTPAVLRQYATRYPAAKPGIWDFATGRPDDIKKVATFFGLGYWKDGAQIIHSMETAMIGPDGRVMRRFSGNDWKAEDVLAALRHREAADAERK